MKTKVWYRRLEEDEIVKGNHVILNIVFTGKVERCPLPLDASEDYHKLAKDCKYFWYERILIPILDNADDEI